MSSILFVDLDHSLLKTDILWEQLLHILTRQPWKIFKILHLGLTNLPGLKKICADQAPLEVATLPYNEDVLHLINTYKTKGKKVVLATASHKSIATQIAHYLNIFDDVIATEDTNLKSHQKLKAMQQYAKKQAFGYVGDSKSDLAIFDASKEVYIMGTLPYVRSHTRLKSPTPFWKACMRLVRPHQWSKNALIAFPLLAAHIFTAQTLVITVIGIIAFSLLASSIYILNDLVDLEDDRRHPRKKHRPLATGDLSIPQACTLATLLLVISFWIVIKFLPMGLTIIASYFFLTTLYSFYLKRIPILDVFCLSGLYTLRIFFGSTINQIPESAWFIAFNVFFFLGLAFNKRATELYNVKHTTQKPSQRRGYISQDFDMIAFTGIVVSLSSIIILSLYLNTPDVILLYKKPLYLWLVVYAILFWKIRLWFLTFRGKINQDPILFALADKPSYGLAIIVFCILYLAT